MPTNQSFYADPATSGLLVEPTLDGKKRRKQFTQPDGSVSTVNTISFGSDQGEVLIPTVIDGKQLTEDEAIAHHRKTGEHYGVFGNVEAANKAAENLHLAHEAMETSTLSGPAPSVSQSEGIAPAVPTPPAVSETFALFGSGEQFDTEIARRGLLNDYKRMSRTFPGSENIKPMLRKDLFLTDRGFDRGEIRSGFAEMAFAESIGETGPFEPLEFDRVAKDFITYEKGKEDSAKAGFKIGLESLFDELDEDDGKTAFQDWQNTQEDETFSALGRKGFLKGRDMFKEHQPYMKTAKQVRDAVMSDGVFKPGDVEDDALAEFGEMDADELMKVLESIAIIENIEGTNRDKGFFAEGVQNVGRFLRGAGRNMGSYVSGNQIERNVEMVLKAPKLFADPDAGDWTEAVLSGRVRETPTAASQGASSMSLDPMPQEWTELTPEQLEDAKKIAAVQKGALRLVRQSGSIRDRVEPLLDDGLFEKSFKVFQDSVLYIGSAMNPATTGSVLLTQFTGQRQAELELQAPNMDVKTRQRLAVQAGGLEAGISRLEAMTLFMKVPKLSKALQGRRYGKAIDGAVRTAVNLPIEIGQEFFEEQSLNTVLQVWKTAGADVPDPKFGETSKHFAEQLGPMSLGMLPLVAMGAGVSVNMDAKMAKALEPFMKMNVMKLAGFTEEEVAVILAERDASAQARKAEEVAKEKGPEQMAADRDENRADPEVMEAAKAELEEEMGPVEEEAGPEVILNDNDQPFDTAEEAMDRGRELGLAGKGHSVVEVDGKFVLVLNEEAQEEGFAEELEEELAGEVAPEEEEAEPDYNPNGEETVGEEAERLKKEAKKPRKVRQRRKGGAGSASQREAYRMHEVIAAIIDDHGGLVSKTRAKKEGRYDNLKGEYDGASRLKNPLHNIIYNKKAGTGLTPDVMAQELFKRGRISSPDADVMWEAIHQAAESMNENAGAEAQQEKNQAQDVDFDRTAYEQDEGETPLWVGDMEVGMTFEIDGEPVTVTAVTKDPETGEIERIVMQDGSRFGRQVIDGSEDVLWVEELTEPEQQHDPDDPFSVAPAGAELAGVKGSPDPNQSQDAAPESEPDFHLVPESSPRETRAAAIAGVKAAMTRSLPNTVPVSMNPNPGKGQATIDAPKVMAALEAILKSVDAAVQTIKVGRLKGRKSLGEFWLKDKIIALQSANDLTTAAHEVGHALEDAMYGISHKWTNKTSGGKAAAAELLKLGKDLYPGGNPKGGWKSEGFAEWFRLYTVGGEAEAAAKAPEFTKFFVAEINKKPDLKKAVEAAQEANKTWSEQGPINRVKESVAKQPGVLDKVREGIATTRANFVVQMIESGDPIKKLVAEAEKRAKKKINPDDDPFLMFQARRMAHDSIVEHMITHGMLNFAGMQVGESLEDALNMVHGQMETFTIYLYAKRAIAMWESPKGARDPGISHADAKAVIAELETPAFQLAAQKVYDWNDGVLNYAAESSPDYAKTVGLIRKGDVGFYIPLFREFDALSANNNSSVGTGKKLVNKLKGSGRRIKNPFESMISQARAVVLKSNQKYIIDQIIKIYDSTPGLGAWISEVPKDMIPAASRSIQDLIDTVERTGGATVDVTDQAILDEVISFWAPAQAPTKAGEDPIIPIFKDGKIRWFRVDHGLYHTLETMKGATPLHWALDLAFGLPTRTFRMGTTGLRASFSLVTNPLRDFRTLQANSRSSANSGRLFLEWMGQMGHAFLHAATAGHYDAKWITAYNQLGGKMATTLGQDMKPTERASRRLFEGKWIRTIDPRNWVDLLRDILQFPELASRATELKMVAKDMGWEPGMPLSVGQSAQLLLAAKQVTTDFTAAGEFAGLMNRVVPFLNASIQGPRAHIIAYQRDPKKFIRRALMGTAAALAAWWRVKDEDWWKELSSEERYGYTYIPFGDEVIRIPRSFEMDGIFMAGAQALAEAWYQQDPEKATEWMGTFIGNFEPSLPPTIQVPAEQLANKSFFFDRPLVGQGMEKLPDEEQITPYTTKLAIWIGEKSGKSPILVDHAIRGFFGGAGADLAALTGRSEAKERESEYAEIPVIGTLWRRGGDSPVRARSVERLYEISDEAVKLQYSNKHDETKDERQLRLQVDDAIQALSLIGEISNQTWSVDERRELNAQKASIAREAVKDYEAKKIHRSKYARERKNQERALRNKAKSE